MAELDDNDRYVLWRLQNCFSPWIVAMRDQCNMTQADENDFTKAFFALCLKANPPSTDASAFYERMRSHA